MYTHTNTYIKSTNGFINGVLECFLGIVPKETFDLQFGVNLRNKIIHQFHLTAINSYTTYQGWNSYKRKNQSNQACWIT